MFKCVNVCVLGFAVAEYVRKTIKSMCIQIRHFNILLMGRLDRKVGIYLDVSARKLIEIEELHSLHSRHQKH